MVVDEKLILNLEKLSRLSLSAEERITLKQDLEAILDMVRKLEEVDTAGVEPLMHMTEDFSSLREDEVRDQLTMKEALKNAPKKQDPFFKVPTVIDRS